MFFSKGERNARRTAKLMLEGGFEEHFYLSQIPKEKLDGLSPAIHYAKFGWLENLDPAPWFSTSQYLGLNPDVRKARANPFLHFLEYGKAEGRLFAGSKNIRQALITPHTNEDLTTHKNASLTDVDERQFQKALVSKFFDLDFYQQQLGHNKIGFEDAVSHYLNVGFSQGFDPHPDFSSVDYLQDHHDVAVAGVNPYFHFLFRGKEEEETRASKPSRLAMNDGVADGKSEWRNYDLVSSKGMAAAGAGEPDLDLLDFTVTLTGLDIAKEVLKAGLKRSQKSKKPDVSVVIPCWNEATVTAECLLSLFNCSDEANIEIVLVNNGSSDSFYKAIKGHPDIKQVDLPTNQGFGPASNIGVEQASGRLVLLLNNDTQLAPGTISALTKAIQADPKVGAVGPKVVSFDGRLQEAGAILNSNGTGRLIGFACAPDDPRFSYSRYVEHLSAACILMRRDEFLQLGGFDPVFAPAYCEDADLSLKLRTKGFRLQYLSEGLVAHHLSKTTAGKESEKAIGSKAKLLSRNRNTLVKRWSAELSKFDIRTIAFYLPQYHPIPENDLWWGKGFTEWRNLTKAKPNFVGHRQPRLPADLGYYDLRVPEVMEQQAMLARRYGVSGFCYYYYRFGEKRLLEAPLERMIKTGSPDFPFCLCWANENWSRRWDGMDEDLLMEQKYGENDAVGFAEDIVRYFKNENYITVDGKPLILFYRLQEIPNPKRYLAVCRNVWKTAGFADVMVAMVESFELSAGPRNPADFGADVTVEFPAHGMVHDPAQNVRRTNANWVGKAHDYRELCNAFMSRKEAGFKRFRSVLVGWDTTPRHPDKSLVLRNSTPGAFQAWLEWTYQRTREQNYGEERLVFINAWNEWCEGSYLEPDLEFGHSYLQAVKNAQESLVTEGAAFVEIN